jgi:hypothetical protein
MHEEVYKFSSTMRGLVIRRCELGYENIILIGSYIYYLSVAPTPSYVFLLPCFCLSMQLRSCVHAIACVWFRVCSLLPLLRFLRAILSRSVTRCAVALGSAPLFRESIATNKRATRSLKKVLDLLVKFSRDECSSRTRMCLL